MPACYRLLSLLLEQLLPAQLLGVFAIEDFQPRRAFAVLHVRRVLVLRNDTLKVHLADSLE